MLKECKARTKIRVITDGCPVSFKQHSGDHFQDLRRGDIVETHYDYKGVGAVYITFITKVTRSGTPAGQEIRYTASPEDFSNISKPTFVIIE